MLFEIYIGNEYYKVFKIVYLSGINCYFNNIIHLDN